MRVLLVRESGHQSRTEEQRYRFEQQQLQRRQEIALLTQPTPAVLRDGDAKLILDRANIPVRRADIDVDPPRNLMRGDAMRTHIGAVGDRPQPQAGA